MNGEYGGWIPAFAGNDKSGRRGFSPHLYSLPYHGEKLMNGEYGGWIPAQSCTFYLNTSARELSTSGGKNISAVASRMTVGAERFSPLTCILSAMYILL